MPKKFISCVKQIKAKQGGKDEPYNPYAVCRESLNYHGPSKDIGLLHPLGAKNKRSKRR